MPQRGATMLTVPQAAARLGIAETTLRVHCRHGRVPGAEFIGGIWLLPDPPEVDRPKMGRPADTVASRATRSEA